MQKLEKKYNRAIAMNILQGIVILVFIFVFFAETFASVYLNFGVKTKINYIDLFKLGGTAENM